MYMCMQSRKSPDTSVCSSHDGIFLPSLSSTFCQVGLWWWSSWVSANSNQNHIISMLSMSKKYSIFTWLSEIIQQSRLEQQEQIVRECFAASNGIQRRHQNRISRCTCRLPCDNGINEQSAIHLELAHRRVKLLYYQTLTSMWIRLVIEANPPLRSSNARCHRDCLWSPHRVLVRASPARQYGRP